MSKKCSNPEPPSGRIMRPSPPPPPPPRVQCGCYRIVNKREDYCFVCKLIGRAKNYE